MAQRSCCVPGCSMKLGGGLPLHRFPNPNNPAQIERFRTWVMKIGGDIIGEDNNFIHKNRKVCHKHFEDIYIFPNKKLSALAIPTLAVPGVHVGEGRHIELPSTSTQIMTASSTRAVLTDTDISSRPVINNEIPLQMETAISTRPDRMDTDMSSRPGKWSLAVVGTSRPGPSKPAASSERPATHTTQRPVRKDQAAAKRALNETSPPRREAKQPRLDRSKRDANRSYAKSTRSDLDVTVTCDRTGLITEEVSNQLLAAIQRKIVAEASSPKQDSPAPTFRARPVYSSGALRLWCCNDHTVAWLRNLIAELPLPTSTTLVIRRQADIKCRVRCGISIPDEQGIFTEPLNIGSTLCYQNPWINVKEWKMLGAYKQADAWYVVVGIPGDQIPSLMKAERRLSFGVGAVYVKFQGPNGRFVDVPQGYPAAEASVETQVVEATPPPTNTG